MEKCVLKHFQNLEQLDPDSLVGSITDSQIIPIKQIRRRRHQPQNS